MTQSNIELWKRRLEAIFHWLWFGLILSIFPLIYNLWKVMGSPNSPRFEEAFITSVAHGELLLICVSAIGTAIGEMVQKETDYRLFRIFIVGCSIFVFLFSALAFSDAARNTLTDIYVAKTSLCLFFVTFLIHLSVICLPKNEVFIDIDEGHED